MRKVASRDVAVWSTYACRTHLGLSGTWTSRRCQGNSVNDTLGAADEAVQTTFPSPIDEASHVHPRRRGPPSELDRIVQDLHSMSTEQRELHLRAKVAASPDELTRAVAGADNATSTATTAKPKSRPETVTVTPPPATHRKSYPLGSAVPRSPPSWTATLELSAVAPNPALEATDISAISFTLEELDEQLFNAAAEPPPAPQTPPPVTADAPEASPRIVTTDEAPAGVAEVVAPPSPLTPHTAPSPTAPAAPPPPPPPPSVPVTAEASGPTPPPPPPPPPPTPPTHISPPPERPEAPQVPTTRAKTSLPVESDVKAAQPAVAEPAPARAPQAARAPMTPTAVPPAECETASGPCVQLGRTDNGELQVELVTPPLSLRTLIDELQEALNRVEEDIASRGTTVTGGTPLPVHLQVSDALRTRAADKVVTEHLFFHVGAATASEVAMTPLERLHFNTAKDNLLRRILSAPQRGWQCIAHLHKGVIARDFGAELLFCCSHVDLTRARGGIVSVGLPSLALGVLPSTSAVQAFAQRLQALNCGELTKLLQTLQVDDADVHAVLSSTSDASAPVTLPVAVKATAHVLLDLHRQDESTTGFNRVLAATLSPSSGPSGAVSSRVGGGQDTSGSLWKRVSEFVASMSSGAPVSSAPLDREAPSSSSSLVRLWRRYCQQCGEASSSETISETFLAAARTAEASNGRRIFLAVNRDMGLVDYTQGVMASVATAHASRWLFVTSDTFAPDAEAPQKVCAALLEKLRSASASVAGPVVVFLSHDYPASLSVQLLATIHTREDIADTQYVTVLMGHPGETAECASVVPLSVTLSHASVPGGRGVEEQLLLHEAARTRPDRARDARLLTGLVEVSVRAQTEVDAETLRTALDATVMYLRQRRVPFVVDTSGAAGLRLAVALGSGVLAATELTSALKAVDAHLARALQFSRSPVAVVTRHFGFRSASFDEAHRRFPQESASLTTKAVFALSQHMRRNIKASEPTKDNTSISPQALDAVAEMVLFRLLEAACDMLITGEVRCAADLDLLSIAALSLRVTSGGLLTVIQQHFGGASEMLVMAERCNAKDTTGASQPLLSPATMALLRYMRDRDISFEQLTEPRLNQFRGLQSEHHEDLSR